MHPIGTIVEHRTKPEFGYGIVVFNFPDLDIAADKPQKINLDELIAVVLWHGNEKHELTDAPQVHPYSELKVLNTKVGFA